MPVVGDVFRGCPPIGACEGAREQTKTRSITTTPVPVQLAVGRFYPAQPKHAGGPPLCRTGGSWNGAFRDTTAGGDGTVVAVYGL